MSSRRSPLKIGLLILCGLPGIPGCNSPAPVQKIRDHAVVLDKQGKLQPWTSYDNIIRWSIDFIQHCPTIQTKYGDDPWYLVSAKFNEDGTFLKKQNNPGSNVYWALETHRKVYAYSGDRAVFEPVRRLIERVAVYHTPADWAWPDVPRTQDDTPDGEYTDEWSGVDKICMVGIGYLNYYKLTGEATWLNKAIKIADAILKHVKPGSATHSPLPFRVNLKTGDVLDPYCSNMILAVQFLDELSKLNIPSPSLKSVSKKRDLLMQWCSTIPCGIITGPAIMKTSSPISTT